MFSDRSDFRTAVVRVGDFAVTSIATATSIGFGRGRTGITWQYARPVRVELTGAGDESGVLGKSIVDFEGKIRVGALAVAALALIVRRVRK